MPLGSGIVERCLEPSKTLGANDPCLAAGPLFPEQTQQRHLLAAALGRVCSVASQLRLWRPLSRCSNARSILLRAQTDWPLARQFPLDGPGERHSPNRHLV